MARRRRASFAERRAERGEVDDPDVVLAAALRFLEARARSRAEVRRRLTQSGYREALVDGAIGRLAELGVLDDEAFARQWVESRDRARPRGERALRQELGRKGIARDVVEGAIQERETSHPDADAVAARQLLSRHRRALDRVSDGRARRQRAYALLARNGFDSDVAAEVVQTIGQEPEPD